MATVSPRKNKNGEIISYQVQVYRGRSADGKKLKPFSTTFTPNPNWSETLKQAVYYVKQERTE